MDVFKRALDYIRRMWGNLNVSQRTGLSVAAIVMALVLAWGSVGGAGEAMVRVVGHEIPDAERSDVLKKLQEKNVRYEVRNLDIYVPREDSERVVLELAGDGVMSDRAVWGFLESNDIFISKGQLDKRYQVALQRKLEMMIRKIDGVRGASVVLSFASEAQRLGFRDGAKASATVQVELRPDAAFNRGQAKSVGMLIARAVPGLDTDRVVLTDTQGRSYGLPRDNSNMAVSDGIRALEAQLEEDIKRKIQELFPSARVVVRAVADAIESVTEEKNHSKPQPMVTEERKRVDKPKPAEAPGTAGRDGTESETKEQNVFYTKYRKDLIPPGIIKKVTVGVLIPVAEGEKEPMTEEDARKFVQAAAGGQADVAGVTVKFLPTKKPEPAAVVPTGEKVMEFLNAKWATLAMVVLGFVALLVFFKLLRGALPRGTVEEIQSLTAQLAEGPELEGSRPDSIHRVRQGIQEVIRRNTSGAADGLKQWMGGPGK